MKVFIFLSICIIQLTSGTDENIQKAITSGLKEVQKTQIDWKTNTQEVLRDIFTLINDTNVEYTKAIERVSNEVITPDQVKAFEEYKAAYEKVIAISKESAEKFTTIHPEIISKLYDPVEIAQDGFNRISEQVEVLKNTCKESALEEVYTFAIEAINEATYCFVEELKSIPLIPQGIRYVKSLITKHIRKTFDQLKICANGDETNCFEELKNYLLGSAVHVEKYSQDDSVPSYGWLKSDSELSKSCVYRKSQEFISKTNGKKEKC